MPALPYLYPCLKSHEPVSLLIIMLGTNDTKERLGANAACIGLGMERLVRKAMAVDCWGPDGKPNILILAPPPILPGLDTVPCGVPMGKGCVEKSREVAKYFKQTADLLGVHFLDAAELGCTFNRVDYMHLTRAAHARLAEELAKAIPSML
jgi:lysophospholipase L1-like esterase